MEKSKINKELEFIKENLINWYQFNKESEILEITLDTETKITEYLKENVTHVNKVDIATELDENIGKFDYIIIHNFYNINRKNINLEKILQYAQSHKKDKGTILISIKNKLGIESMNCIDVEEEQNIENQNIYSKKEIEKILANNQIKNYKFYYLLPNENYPNIIFTDEHLPSQEGILRDLTLYNKDILVKEDEREIYRRILNEDINLFKIFANSFLIEISDESIKNDIVYVTFGNSRKEKYRLKTVMRKSDVYKEAVTKKAKEHIKEIKNNIEILENSKINMLDFYKDGCIYSKLITEKQSFDKELIKEAKNNGTESIIEPIRKFKEELENKLEISEEIENTVFEKYKIECSKEIKDKLHFVKDGIFDLIFQNCFVLDNKFNFYDQEWKQSNIPLEFIIYRAIYYLGNSNSKIDTNMLYNAFELNDFIQSFEQLEIALQEEIKDETIWNIHRQEYLHTRTVYDTMIHYRNLHAEIQKDYQKLEEKNKEIEAKNMEKDIQIKELQDKINYMENSRSWKITKPLRKLREGKKKNEK